MQRFIVNPGGRCLLPFRGLLLLILISCLVTACQPDGPHNALEEYILRLGRTLEVEPRQIQPIIPPPPPRPGTLRIEQPVSALDALDFLALTGCAVQVTIGKRNSSLGRMAAPSQRLLLELEYLRLAPACIELQQQEGKSNLAETLQTAWEAKREQLPGSIFNATLGGTEYRQFWRASIAPGDYPAATGSQAISALESINGMVRRWLDDDYQADNLAFEIALGEVATGDGGALLEALAMQGSWLIAANTMLAESNKRGPLCAPGVRYPAADILPNVIRRHFVGQVQPHSAALGSRYHQLLPPLEALETMLEDALPRAFLGWREERDTLLDQLMQAPRRHVEALQSTLAPCGGMTTDG